VATKYLLRAARTTFRARGVLLLIRIDSQRYERRDGLDTFFQPGVEILVARDTADVIAVMQLPPAEIARIAQAGRQRVLDSHTAAHRAAELETILDSALDHHATFQPTVNWVEA
jgi:hypothetical protein